MGWKNLKIFYEKYLKIFQRYFAKISKDILWKISKDILWKVVLMSWQRVGTSGRKNLQIHFIASNFLLAISFVHESWSLKGFCQDYLFYATIQPYNTH